MRTQSQLMEMQAAIISCIDALAPVVSGDHHPSEIFKAIEKAHQALEVIPNIQSLKRTALKDSSAEAAAALAERHIREYLNGGDTNLFLMRINGRLCEALEKLQTELKQG